MRLVGNVSIGHAYYLHEISTRSSPGPSLGAEMEMGTCSVDEQGAACGTFGKKEFPRFEKNNTTTQPTNPHGIYGQLPNPGFWQFWY